MTTTAKTFRLALAACAALAIGAGATAQAAPKAASKAAADKPALEQPAEGFRALDRIVAVVNTDVITEFELQNRVRQVAVNLRRQNIELPPMLEMRRQVLDRLVTEKAMQQRAKELGLRVDEQMVSAAVDQIARSNKLTGDELKRRVAEEGVSWSAFRSQVREEILQQRLREREVDSKIKIPESEVDAFIADQAGFSGGDATEYRLQHILLPLSLGAPDSEVREQRDLAEDLAARAARGEDFGSLATANSKADDAFSGGDLGWRDAGRLPSAFWEAIQGKARPGFITTVVTDHAVHVIKVAGVRDGVQAKLASQPVEQTHARHILMFVSDMTPEAQVVTRLNDLRRRILAGEADFQTYARLHSVDSSATRGGDLGWMSKGDTVPEFEQAMAALQPGGISEPVRTQFGYHLIQVVERRTQAPDAARSRAAARQTLREKKLAEAATDWQRQIHDKAYVEIRDEQLRESMKR
ncbi:MAG: peptidylprolyl isomerase [Duodenibacillus sp.]|nr:peptidylprolyl isomerase [Duodenibacillus sp.]